MAASSVRTMRRDVAARLLWRDLSVERSNGPLHFLNVLINTATSNINGLLNLVKVLNLWPGG